MRYKTNILNNADVKSVNKSLILKKIKQAQPVTRQYIVSELGLSSPTVSTVFDELRKCGIIRECGIQKSSGGRRSTLYEICPEAGAVISTELKNSGISLQLYNFLGEKAENYVREFTEKEHVADVLSDFLEEIINEKKGSGNILGIGICLSGYISQRYGFVESKNLGIRRTKINEFVRNTHNLKLVIEDKIRSAAYYYKWENAVSGNHGATLFIDINTGIGASIIINNEIYRGFNDFAGEMGHLIFDGERGRDCTDGFSGCLEALSNEKAIVGEVKRRILNGDSSCVADIVKWDIEKINIGVVLEALGEGDVLAAEVMTKAVNYIFIALINVIRLIDPERIYIMSSIAFKENLDKLMNTDRNKALFEEIGDRLVFIDDNEIFLKGAAAMVLGDVYENIDRYFELDSQE
ncbi:MAG: ROK family transcriptional regulator [Clostridiaceae bacterium]